MYVKRPWGQHYVFATSKVLLSNEIKPCSDWTQQLLNPVAKTTHCTQGLQTLFPSD